MAKRVFDIVFALFLLTLLFWLIIISVLMAAIETHTSGLFIQERIGQFGNKFKIYKVRTIRESFSSVALPISKIGQFLRKFRIDELPQLFNVLKGDMSIVGPRPDVSGYYDLLKGENRKLLELKPGLTSMATIKYTNEDAILNKQADPLVYNDTFIFPDKVKLNLDYYYNHSICGDFRIILETIKVTLFKKN
ncbi:sugar transferase [uncultured Flavobacterium sp.]|uniref:sugar transferase n=1 Tax=uncultured Flavobacterium sp. TaxID=165435 RepID=UPI0030ED49EC|tara:strand:+ start:2379 stop:2954 length:576 start_codon:yes stop_codon:yes gene_type:complete